MRSDLEVELEKLRAQQDHISQAILDARASAERLRAESQAQEEMRWSWKNGTTMRKNSISRMTMRPTTRTTEKKTTLNSSSRTLSRKIKPDGGSQLL